MKQVLILAEHYSHRKGLQAVFLPKTIAHFVIMAERPVRFSLSLYNQPGNTISSTDISAVSQEQLPIRFL